MDNCGGGGQRLPPDGDEFPAAYQEFTSPSLQYQYLTTRETMAANGDVDRGESTLLLSNKPVNKPDDTHSPLANYVLYSAQKPSNYYSKEESDPDPPPLPLTGPPSKPERKFSPSGELWRQDNMSEKSVKDKIAMFSSQSSLEAPLFPSPLGRPRPRLAKHKSSDDVFAEDSKPSLPQSSPPPSPDGYLRKTSSPESGSSSPYSSCYNSSPSKSFDATPTSPTSKSPNNGLTRATSFSGSSPFLLQTAGELLSNSSPMITRTNSLASTFKRPGDEFRKNSLNQLIEQRRKGISKLRGLVIPEKDAVPVDQPIMDLPEIKSRDLILNNQVRHLWIFNFITYVRDLSLCYVNYLLETE